MRHGLSATYLNVIHTTDPRQPNNPTGLLLRALQSPALALALAGSSLALPADISPLLHAGLRAIDLKNQGLVGTIPPSWAQLAAALTKIDLSNNRLTGPIPAPLLTVGQRAFSRNAGLCLPGTPDVPTVLGQLTELDLSGQGCVSNAADFTFCSIAVFAGGTLHDPSIIPYTIPSHITHAHPQKPGCTALSPPSSASSPHCAPWM